MTLDPRAGYHHIPLDKPSIPKTAFNSPFGNFEYVKVPFGLAQAPAYFQELMTGILKDFNFAIDPYLPRHMPYNMCNHQLHPNKLEPFLAWSDIIESSSKDSQK